MRKKNIVKKMKKDLKAYQKIVEMDNEYMETSKGKVTKEFEQIAFSRHVLCEYLERFLEQV
jgi:hypothetical protein